MTEGLGQDGDTNRWRRSTTVRMMWNQAFCIASSGTWRWPVGQRASDSTHRFCLSPSARTLVSVSTEPANKGPPTLNLVKGDLMINKCRFLSRKTEIQFDVGLLPLGMYIRGMTSSAPSFPSWREKGMVARGAALNSGRAPARSSI